MATDMFLDLGQKIKGEAVDAAFKDTIQVLAWSWGVSNSGTFHMGKGGGAGKANFQDISFTKYIDTASCPLISACSGLVSSNFCCCSGVASFWCFCFHSE